ncbi:complex I subunit 1 family protein, partial [Longimicrobium sp.]|uniref:complex I subunit 1/NuoH family protein n=1 Tax=Longimicrobium sp. TaxID=2029185 RepID=UPI002E34103E
MQAGQAVAKFAEVTGTAYLVSSVIKLLIVFVAVLVIVAMLTLLERKISAWMQDRLGPNRVGPGGLLQPAADGIKNILKEESNPGEVNKVFFTLAPMLSITPAMVTFAVIPFAAPLPTPWGVVPMMIADLPVGILFLLAFSSLGVYGIVVAGWASSNKYALLGGLRAGAPMIS